MTTTAPTEAPAAAARDRDDAPLRPLSVNIQPILKSIDGLLDDAEIDGWFERFAKANEGRGFYLELTREGELTITPMVNKDGAFAEVELITDLRIWSRRHGGRSLASRAILRLPDGTRAEPDAAWLSPEQVAAIQPLSESVAITLCPAFVAEIMSSSDRLPPLQDKMENYIANGAMLGWLVDPRRRRVYVYRPDAEMETLEDPETVSGEPILPGFEFEVRRLVFDLL